jgi:hypothetical protein
MCKISYRLGTQLHKHMSHTNIWKTMDGNNPSTCSGSWDETSCGIVFFQIFILVTSTIREFWRESWARDCCKLDH